MEVWADRKMKKEKDTKIVRNRFSVSDSKRMESYLETMAGQGWMLDKTERLFWRFRKTAPRKLHFSVIYMNPDDGILQSREDLLAEFRARCVRDGWTPVASDKYFQVICTDREHPDEIKTDPSEALASMHQAAVEKNGDKVSFSVLFFLYLLFSTFTFSPLERLSGGLYALSCLLGLAGILLLPVGMLRYLHWEKAMRKAIQHATPPPKKGPGDLREPLNKSPFI